MAKKIRKLKFINANILINVLIDKINNLLHLHKTIYAFNKID